MNTSTGGRAWDGIAYCPSAIHECLSITLTLLVRNPTFRNLPFSEIPVICSVGCERGFSTVKVLHLDTVLSATYTTSLHHVPQIQQ